MANFYPPIQPYQTHFLKVSDLHTLYVAEAGNPKGEPILFVHGGPGSGVRKNDSRFFNPDKFRIILVDQRGCGKSTPFLELKENDTENLIQDMEKVRKFLGILKWNLFGGSWGSTLALLYAQAFPKVVKSLILRGIFLFSKQEIDWFLNGIGVKNVYPAEFLEYQNFLPKNERAEVLKNYCKRAFSKDEDLARQAFLNLSKYENSISKLVQDKTVIQNFLKSDSALSMGKIELWYMQNLGFLKPNQILDNMHKIVDIAGYIVHGRYDMVCKFESAYRLHQAWSKSKLYPVISGHASSDPEMKSKLIEVCDEV